MWQGTMRSEGKRPRTTSVIDPLLHDSLRRELIHSWWSDQVVMALAAWWWWPHPIWLIISVSQQLRRQRDITAETLRGRNSHAICPCSPRTYTVLTTLQRTRSIRRVAGSLAIHRLRPEIKQIWHKVQHTVVQCVDTPTISGIFRYNFHTQW